MSASDMRDVSRGGKGSLPRFARPGGGRQLSTPYFLNHACICTQPSSAASLR